MHQDNAKPPVASPLRKVLPSQPREKRLAFWKRAFSGLGDISVPAGTDPAAFDFYGHSWQLPHAFLQVNGASAMTMSRPQHVIDERPVEQMALHLFIEGGAICVYDGQVRRHAAGDIAFVDYSMPYEIHTPGYEGIGITFDKASAPPRLQACAHGLALPVASSAGAMLGAHIRSLVEHVEGLSVEQAQSAIDGILRFAEAAVPATATNTMRDSASLFERASWVARQQLSNPDFGPNELANALNVSRSKLFRSFAPHGGVQRWLLAARLRASLHNLMVLPGTLKVAEVASRHGFRSEAHFSRAFSKRYQTSPSAARDLVNQAENSLFYLGWTSEHEGAETATLEAWLASLRSSGGAPD